MGVVTQEELVSAAMEYPGFVNAQHRLGGESAGYAPTKLFNDFPVESALPFLSGASARVLLIQDDLIITKPMSPCFLFTSPPDAAQKLFAFPVVEDGLDSDYDAVFAGLERNTARHWAKIRRDLISADDASKLTPSGLAFSYHRPFHSPQLLNISILRSMWERMPLELSVSLDMPFRHLNMTDIVGLHHSELAFRGY